MPVNCRLSKAVNAAIVWLVAQLKEGPVYCRQAIEDAVKAGHGRNTFFKAVRELGVVTGGEKPNKFYRMPTREELAERGEDGEVDPDDMEDDDQ